MSPTAAWTRIEIAHRRCSGMRMGEFITRAMSLTVAPLYQLQNEQLVEACEEFASSQARLWKIGRK